MLVVFEKVERARLVQQGSPVFDSEAGGGGGGGEAGDGAERQRDQQHRLISIDSSSSTHHHRLIYVPGRVQLGSLATVVSIPASSSASSSSSTPLVPEALALEAPAHLGTILGSGPEIQSSNAEVGIGSDPAQTPNE